MQAILCSTFGAPSVLTVGEAPPPALKPGQVRIRVHASGVNRADIMQRRGNYPPPAGESDILGLEAAGDIIEVAGDVKSFQPGQRVMVLLAGGGYAQEVCVDAGLVMPLPARLSYLDGAAIPEAFITAHHNLFTLGGVAANQTALVHAAASGVGTAALQLLSRDGARVFATVGSEEKAGVVRQLGARAIVCPRASVGRESVPQQPFDAIVRAETSGRGVDIILDPVGGAYLAMNLKSLAVDGRIVQIAYLAGRETTIDLALVLAKRARLIGSTLRPLPIERKRAAVAAFYQQFAGDLETGAVKPIIDKVFPAASAREAHEHMEADRNIGKILLEW